MPFDISIGIPAISLSLINFGLYFFQQFGMALGVGAQTVMLVAFLQSIRDGVVDEEEKGFAKAVRRVMDFGLFLILATGVGVLAIQYFMGQPLAIFSTTFLFKWSLLGIVLVMALVNRGTSTMSGLLQGLAAGTWYAMFVVHILAPQASWQQFGEFYGAWLVGFMLCWTILVFALKGKRKDVQPMAGIKSVAQPAVVISPTRMAPIAPRPSAHASIATPSKPLFASLFKRAPVAPTEVVITPSAPIASAPKPAMSAPPPPPLPPPPPAPKPAPAPAQVMPPPIAVQMQKPPSPAPLPPISTPAVGAQPEKPFVGLNVMPKNPQDLQK